MLNILRFLIITITLASLVCCGGSSTEEAESLIDTVVETPTEDSVETPVEPPTKNDNALVQPNILFIISDDQGLDASAQYDFSADLPQTPTLNMLAQQGITFENMWVTPACSTTRSTIITGKYGVNNGVESLPGNLSAEHEILQQYLKGNVATDNYQSAVFGKWHIGGTNETHPNDVGVDYYAGNIGNLSNYYDWSLTINGVVENSTVYHSTKITDLALSWISEQTTPWFTWVAYSAPHSPFHLPPQSLHNRSLSGTSSDITNNKRDYYLAAIEAMDAEIGRLLASLDEETRNNTIVIFIGDNGTPSSVIDTSAYSKIHAKGSLYQGGIATPFIVSGQGVTRLNERESALITATDLYATIAEIAGVSATKVHDSQSFKSLFTDGTHGGREYSYTAYKSDEVTGWATRSKDYKLIQFEDGSQELYLLSDNLSGNVSVQFSETNNLLPTNDGDLLAQVTNLAAVSALLYQEENINPLDITNVTLINQSKNCVDYIEQFTSSVNDINNGVVFHGELVITQIGEKCVFNTNAIPNHDFNDGGSAFPNDVSEQSDLFEITISPTKANQVTPISLQVDNAILLNGVKVDLLAAGCYGVGNGKVGCNDNDQPWRYDPMHAANGFAVDSHNAHAQPNGTYHYHGSPIALFEDNANQDSTVIGFAADGFPIYGTYFDDQGEVRSVRSSYRLKSGDRPNGAEDPGGSYDGTFRDDYEYVEGLGDLDACNGMTLNGAYAYYITLSYPYVLSCFTGTPDSSFTK